MAEECRDRRREARRIAGRFSLLRSGLSRDVRSVRSFSVVKSSVATGKAASWPRATVVSRTSAPSLVSWEKTKDTLNGLRESSELREVRLIASAQARGVEPSRVGFAAANREHGKKVGGGLRWAKVGGTKRAQETIHQGRVRWSCMAKGEAQQRECAQLAT